MFPSKYSLVLRAGQFWPSNVVRIIGFHPFVDGILSRGPEHAGRGGAQVGFWRAKHNAAAVLAQRDVHPEGHATVRNATKSHRCHFVLLSFGAVVIFWQPLMGGGWVAESFCSPIWQHPTRWLRATGLLPTVWAGRFPFLMFQRVKKTASYM